MQVVSPPTQPLSHTARPELELVSGGRDDPQPLGHGLRLIRDLLQARSCVLFSVFPEAAEWHAALGDDSAMLAAQLGQQMGALHKTVQGPCLLFPETARTLTLEGCSAGT